MLTFETIPLPQPVVANDVFETIYQRRAVRRYADKTVDRAVVDQIVNAGRMAPSALNRQPYRMIIADDQKDIAAFAAAIQDIVKALMSLAHGVDLPKSEDPVFYKAPVVIFLAGPEKDEWAGIDIGMCAQNMMLAAKSIGLDSCPVGFASFVTKTRMVSRLPLAAGEKVYLAVIVGYGEETPDFHGRKNDNVQYLAG